MTSPLSFQVANIYISNCIKNSSTEYQKTMEQLSSGSKFTSMGDDPIGVSEATNIEIEINYNSRIKSNASVGSDMLTMVDGYQEGIISNIQRIHDLTVQAVNGAYDSTDKTAVINEINARLKAINSNADSANFNDIKILDGTNTSLTLNVGKGTSGTINVGSTLINTHTGATGLDIDLTDPMTDADWSNYLTKLDAASDKLTTNCAKIGAYINRLDSISDNLTNKNITLSDYKSTISDADTAQVSADLVNYQILQQLGTNMFVQSNQMHQAAYSLLQAAAK